jgi:carbon-monoxide dehydrogenase medium subunit
VQVPAPFEYERATSVDHALELLRQLGPEARILAGGHSLLPMMKLRLATPEYLIDIDWLASWATSGKRPRPLRRFSSAP